jgi:hypothetical protein
VFVVLFGVDIPKPGLMAEALVRAGYALVYIHLSECIHQPVLHLSRPPILCQQPKPNMRAKIVRIFHHYAVPVIDYEDPVTREGEDYVVMDDAKDSQYWFDAVEQPFYRLVRSQLVASGCIKVDLRNQLDDLLAMSYRQDATLYPLYRSVLQLFYAKRRAVLCKAAVEAVGEREWNQFPAPTLSVSCFDTHFGMCPACVKYNEEKGRLFAQSWGEILGCGAGLEMAGDERVTDKCPRSLSIGLLCMSRADRSDEQDMVDGLWVMRRGGVGGDGVVSRGGHCSGRECV